jgi:hypothetical protein
MLSGHHVAKGGNPNSTSGDDFVPILFDDSPTADSWFDDTRGDVASCIVPQQMRLEVLFTQSGSSAAPVSRVCGARVRWSYSRWQWTCAGQKACASIQRFPVSMAVEYVQLPVRWHFQNTSRSNIVRPKHFFLLVKCRVLFSVCPLTAQPINSILMTRFTLHKRN